MRDSLSKSYSLWFVNFWNVLFGGIFVTSFFSLKFLGYESSWFICSAAFTMFCFTMIILYNKQLEDEMR